MTTGTGFNLTVDEYGLIKNQEIVRHLHVRHLGETEIAIIP